MRQVSISCAVFACMAIGAAQMLDAQPGTGRGGFDKRGDPGFAKRLMKFDKNNDGDLSKKELPELIRQRLLDRGDTNENGVLEAKEIKKLDQTYGQRGFGFGGNRFGGRFGGFGGNRFGGGFGFRVVEPMMKALDADGNGELSAKELTNAVKALKKLDKNNDGKLSGTELRPSFGGFGGGRPGGFGVPGGGPQQPGGFSGRPRRPGGGS